ncbi:MAG: tail fiber domain-containing protein [Candidatus Pacebacteria bacterium]|nr:tail fiber domain-containing protein [Candidatus Paceibacterota bacterium]
MKILKNVGLVLGIVFSIFSVSFMVLAWSAPSSAPTGGNVAIPINESSASQVKSGALGVSLLQAENNILVGTTDTTKATIYSKTTQNNPLRIDGQCGCENYYWFNGSSWKRAMTKGSMYPALFIEKGTNNVGIGHISIGNELPPLSAKLHVAQANMAVSPFHVQHKEYVGPGFSSDQAWRWATSLFIAPYTANVGIGTANPQSKLHVAGDMIVDGNISIGTANPQSKLHIAGDMIVDGSIQAVAYYYPSDIRLKKEIKPIDNNVLERVLSLEPVRFKWINNDVEDIGLIAQDVEVLFPELVGSNNNGEKSIDYAKLTVFLIESLKEQQKEIDNLKSSFE